MPDQHEFDFLIPISRPLLRIDEVMSILRLRKDAIYALIDEGKLEPHQDGPNAVYRITRRSVLAHLLKTAKYKSADYISAVITLAKQLPASARADLKAQL